MPFINSKVSVKTTEERYRHHGEIDPLLNGRKKREMVRKELRQDKVR